MVEIQALRFRRTTVTLLWSWVGSEPKEADTGAGHGRPAICPFRIRLIPRLIDAVKLRIASFTENPHRAVRVLADSGVPDTATQALPGLIGRAAIWCCL